MNNRRLSPVRLGAQSAIQVVDNAALQLSVPSSLANRVTNFIERSEEIARNQYKSDVLICWEHPETTKLAHIIDQSRPEDVPEIPSPMLRDYKWPGIYKPFDHQKTTASFLSLRKRAFCFNEAGTGKTSAAIWAADYLLELGLVKRVLVICPLSIMYSAWQADIFKTAMHRTAAVAFGPRDKRIKIVQDSYDFVIINYDGVNIIRDEIANGGFDLILVDELLTLLVLSFLSPAQAQTQGIVTLDTLKVSLWSEYDQPSMLVFYDFTLTGDTQVPGVMDIRFPKDANITAVAYQNGGQLLLANYQTKERTDPNWQVITLFIAERTTYHIEYYQPLGRDGNQRSFTYWWPGDYSVNEFDVEVQVPDDSKGVKTDPAIPLMQNQPFMSGGAVMSGLEQGE